MSFDPPLEGQTPIDDISGLLDKSVTTTAQLNAAEAENIRKAAVRYLAAKASPKQAPFDLNWSKRLHAQMLGDIWSWAGKFHTINLNMGVQPHTIETDLHNLFQDLHAWNDTDMPIIEQAARLHHRAVVIHPFINGNGRWSRMLANIWLKQHNALLTLWPETTIGAQSTTRTQYIQALKAADQGDIRPFIKLHETHQDHG